MEQFAALRLGSVSRSLDTRAFDQGLYDLQGTRYNLNALQSDAPGITHCISAIRYLLEKSTKISLPKAYIGDMCQTICTFHGNLEPRIIPLSEEERGDLVFFISKSVAHSIYMISHVGIFIDEKGNLFHSSWKRGGSIENIDSYTNTGRIATCRILSSRTDPRSLR